MRAGSFSLNRPWAFAAGTTTVTDVVVPEVFTGYVQVQTMERSALIQSGVIQRSPQLDGFLSGGGLTFNQPFWNDLDNDEENIPVTNPATLSTPNKIDSGTEIQVRLNRNQSWASMDLAADLAGSDPMTAIGNRVAAYWARRIQAAFVATMTGVFADNDANDSGDYTHDISGAVYDPGTTDFSAEGFIDAVTTMGDAMGFLTMVMVHSVVYNRMQKNNLIDFIPDAVNPNAAAVPTFLQRRVIVDDGITNAAGVFHTWLFGAGAVQMGSDPPANPTEVERVPAAGNGGGSETLHSRQQWILHPVGHAYVGTPPAGGPSNAATANNLAAAASWNRVFPERKQIRVARLITREF
jgi:hypothetical protein